MKAFGHVDTWVFDLDNTLYPASCRLFDQMHVKMADYVMRRFGVDYPAAFQIQKSLYQKYGTTLRGLMVEHGEAPQDFLAHVHDIDYGTVPHSPGLAAALSALPGRKLVFTNGTTEHARRVMERLGVSTLFDGIYDIVDSDHIPKPAKEPYDKFLADFSVAARSTAFFEDIARNLEVPHALGMVTVLVTSEGEGDAKRLTDELPGAHVQHVTPDLTDFLTRIEQHEARQ